ncbi:MAG TPA: hypothetical protein VHB21_18755 [Minicystis sp.]|nr:hypothetical protein [Minicystis sp.]
MAEEMLDDAQVDARLEQVSREAVPQDVRPDGFVDPGAPRSAPERDTHGLGANATADRVGQDAPACRDAPPAVGRKGVDERLREEHLTLASSLAANAQHATLQVDVLVADLESLAEAEPAPIEQQGDSGHGRLGERGERD